MNTKCNECIYEYPSVNCVNCGSKHYNFTSKKTIECDYCKGNNLNLKVNQPKFNYCPMCGRKL